MAKEELFRIPVVRRVIWRLGAFPVERGGADRRALRLAREVLRRGDVLLMFPEGTREPGGAPAARAARRRVARRWMPGVAVVPAAIWGSQMGLAAIRVVFGPPLDLSDLDGRPAQPARAGGRRAHDGRDRRAAAAGRGPGAGPARQPRPGAAPPEVVDG